MADVKEVFRAKVAAATDKQLWDGVPKLKYKLESDQADHIEAQADYNLIILGEAALAAQNAVEEAKRNASLTQWKLITVRDEIIERLQGQDPVQGTF